MIFEKERVNIGNNCTCSGDFLLLLVRHCVLGAHRPHRKTLKHNNILLTSTQTRIVFSTRLNFCQTHSSSRFGSPRWGCRLSPPPLSQTYYLLQTSRCMTSQPDEHHFHRVPPTHHAPSRGGMMSQLKSVYLLHRLLSNPLIYFFLLQDCECYAIAARIKLGASANVGRCSV